jgi:flagellar FliL protein
MVGDAAGTPQPQEAPTSTATCTPPEPGAALILDSITLNLADGRYLKLGLALQLSATADPKAMQEAGAGARALDAAIELFGAERYDDLISVDQRQAIKAKLSDTVTTSYKGEVLGVYFTEFVMQ